MDVAHQLVVPGQRCRNVAVAASGKYKGGDGDSHVPREMPPIYVPPREDSRRPASPAADDGSRSSSSTSAPAGLEEPRPSVEAGRAGSGQATFCDRLLSCFGLCS